VKFDFFAFYTAVLESIADLVSNKCQPPLFLNLIKKSIKFFKMNEIESLLTYISSKGAVVQGVEFKDSPDSGCGIFAKSQLTKGESLISVPFSLCITANSIAISPQLKGIFVDNPGFLDYPDEVLAIGLMFAMTTNTTCDWIHHVKTMPKTFNSTIFWSEDELLELKDCMVFQLTKMMRNQIANDYQSLHKPLAEAYPELLGSISIELYTWALSVVYSRSIELTRNGVHVRCIVPILDMANHNPEAASSAFDTFHYDDFKDTISLLASGPLSAGEECFAIYGHYPNGKLIYNYGFVILNNPHRAVDLWTRLAPTSFQYETKQKALQSSDLTCNQTYDFKGTIRPGVISPALLATIRVVQIADEEEMQRIDNAFTGRMVSVRNEMAAYASLSNLIMSRMKIETAQVGEETLHVVCWFHFDD
jgi:hypothetical protein